MSCPAVSVTMVSRKSSNLQVFSVNGGTTRVPRGSRNGPGLNSDSNDLANDIKVTDLAKRSNH